MTTTNNTLDRFAVRSKVAIVTGGTRGIGLAIARLLGEAGARVVISSRKDEHVSEVVATLQREGLTVAGVAANMGQTEDVRRLAAFAAREFDGIDIIVNNAATNPTFGPLQHSTMEAFDTVMAVNVKGPLELCRTAHRVMAARGGGSIVNISSIGGVSPEPGLGMYSVSKAALISLTKVMAQEWGSDGIRANAICPGLIRTRFSAALWKDEHIANQVLGQQPIRRIGEPEDVAGLALFLASEAAAYCTGGVYMADGGYLL
jgi:dehydrogenase/reductase SDR family protein 4